MPDYNHDLVFGVSVPPSARPAAELEPIGKRAIRIQRTQVLVDRLL